MAIRNSTTPPTHEDGQTIQKLLVGVIGLIDTFSAEQRGRRVLRADRGGRPDRNPLRLGRGLVRGEPYYFRVQTRLLLIEMVNAVDSGNHLHSVLHDFAHDSLRDHAAHRAEHGTHLATRTTLSEGTELQANDGSW